MGGRRAVGAERTEGPSRHAEEPGAGEVGLEGLAPEHRPNDDCRAAEEPEEGGAHDAELARFVPRRVGRRSSSGVVWRW